MDILKTPISEYDIGLKHLYTVSKALFHLYGSHAYLKIIGLTVRSNGSREPGV